MKFSESRPLRESPVRSKATLFLLLVTLVPRCYSAAPAPVDCAHLLAWIAGGVSSPTLVRTVRLRGVSFATGPSIRGQLRSAGATTELLSALTQLKPTQAGDSCPATLIQAGGLVQHKQYEAAGDIVSTLLENNPRNGALHFAFGYIKQQQGD